MSTYLDIIKSENYDDIFALFESNKPSYMEANSEYSSDKTKNEFDVTKHSVMIPDENNRPDKTIWKPVMDPLTGEPAKDTSTQKAKKEKGTVKVNRVPLPLQEIIVNRRVSFLLGNPIKYDVTYNSENKQEKAVVEYVYEIEDNAKTLYKNKELARRVMSEMACAELWYLTSISEPGLWNYIAKKIGIKKPKLQFKMKVLSPWLNDKLYPLFDEYGDMIAFARGYVRTEDKSEIDHFDVFTADIIYKYAKRENGWELDSKAVSIKLDGTKISGGKVVNPIKKIPIIYHSQQKPEWANVQKMIDRLEKLLSNHGDMNDYFGEPILAIFGQIIQAIPKGDSGKILQLSEQAKASFLALDSPPESIKMEVENLEKFIYALSQTPNISFSELKAMGGKDISGYAIELLFLDAHLAVRAKEETFGIGIQRRINLIKTVIGNVLDLSLSEASESVRMKPVFTPYMPKNAKEIIETLGQATNSEIMSKQTATEKLEDEGIIPDASAEIDRLNEEAIKSLSEPVI